MKNICSIPDWNERSLLPPIRDGATETSPDRSPYSTTIVSFVDRFAITPERLDILQGFLAYRNLLRNRGIIDGIQWVNGSFVEHVEITRNTAPHDIDVVTFFKLPEGETQESFLAKAGDLWNHEDIKKKYHIDSYLNVFGPTDQPYVRQQLTYWYSMWSHTRNAEWKGFVELDLDASLDAEAKSMLENMRKEEGNDE